MYLLHRTQRNRTILRGTGSTTASNLITKAGHHGRGTKARLTPEKKKYAGS